MGLYNCFLARACLVFSHAFKKVDIIFVLLPIFCRPADKRSSLKKTVNIVMFELFQKLQGIGQVNDTQAPVWH